MFKLSKLALGVALVACSIAANAKLAIPTYDELPNLAPEGIHQTACTRTANSYIRAHYKSIDVDIEFANKVIKQYLYYMDYNKSIFTKHEVDEIYANSDRIIRAILLCDLSYPYELYNISTKKRYQKYTFFVNAIKEDKLDLTIDDSVEFNRKDADFLPDETALKKQWINELKNDYILQILSEKTKEEAKKRLLRRYNAALAKLSQIKSEDVFSIFENSFATAIDPHTSYLSPDDSENFNDNLNLSLEGIGAVLTSEDEYTVINSILPGSPAEKTKKLKAKDKIVGVRQADGSYEDIIGWRLNEVVKKIKGPKGTKVTLDIERGEGSQMTTFSVDIIRDKVRLQDSEAKIEIKEHQGKNIAVLKIKSFYTNLHQDIKKEIARIKSEGKKIDALIIDLRNNGGGLLPEATLSSGLFIKSGPIVLVRDARGNVIPQYDSDITEAYDGPLVVLINRLSASSSEIMAAALRDYGRALIVGDTSFGKGTVQQSKPLARVYDFSDEQLGSIHYTIAKFYRINGGSTQLKGVSPDIFLPTGVDSKEFGESSEPNALPWDKINPVQYSSYLNIDAYVPELTAKSNKRVNNSLAFKIIKEDLERYYKLKDKKVISVNLAKREQMKKEDDAYALKTTNQRLKLMGKSEVAKVKDLPDDFEFDDTILNETVIIASDFADAQKAKLYKAQPAPILNRYPVDRDEISKGSGLQSPPGAAAMPARPEASRIQANVMKGSMPPGAKNAANEALDKVVYDSNTMDYQSASSLAHKSHQDDATINNTNANELANAALAAEQESVNHTLDGRPYSVVCDTGEINNMDRDGTLLGPWRTVNEDDTFLRVSDNEFQALLKQHHQNSMSAHFKDSLYPTVLQEQETVANKENYNSGSIVLGPKQ